MKTKTLVLIGLCATLSMSMHAQDIREVVLEKPGKLMKQVKKELGVITKLKISGNINSEDFETLSQMPNLQYLDLKETHAIAKDKHQTSVSLSFEKEMNKLLELHVPTSGLNKIGTLNTPNLEKLYIPFGLDITGYIELIKQLNKPNLQKAQMHYAWKMAGYEDLPLERIRKDPYLSEMYDKMNYKWSTSVHIESFPDDYTNGLVKCDNLYDGVDTLFITDEDAVKKIGIERLSATNAKRIMVNGYTVFEQKEILPNTHGEYELRGYISYTMDYTIERSDDDKYICTLRFKDGTVFIKGPIEYTSKTIKKKDGIKKTIDEFVKINIDKLLNNLSADELFSHGSAWLDEYHGCYSSSIEHYAMEFLEKADELGNKAATVLLGDEYFYHGDRDRNAKAYKYYKKLADDGDPHATFMVYCCVAGTNDWAPAFRCESFDEEINVQKSWLNLAIKRGSTEAIEEKARLKKKAIKDAEADRQARREAKEYAEWEKKHPAYVEGCTFCKGTGVSLMRLSERCPICLGRGYLVKRK